MVFYLDFIRFIDQLRENRQINLGKADVFIMLFFTFLWIWFPSICSDLLCLLGTRTVCLFNYLSSLFNWSFHMLPIHQPFEFSILVFGGKLPCVSFQQLSYQYFLSFFFFHHIILASHHSWMNPISILSVPLFCLIRLAGENYITEKIGTIINLQSAPQLGPQQRLVILI